MITFFKEKNIRNHVALETSDKDAIKSILGEGMTIAGDVYFTGKVRVDGNIQGNIKGEYLILSESGNITGDIEAACFVCYGKIEGSVITNKLFVKKSAVIHGKLDTTELSIDAGASLKGEVIAHCQDSLEVEKSSLEEDDPHREIKPDEDKYQFNSKTTLFGEDRN